VTFDPAGPLRIIEISTGGDNALDWLEIYSEWKVWSKLSDNLKYPPAFRVVGGDPISDIQDLGSTFFLLAPWKFRPAELDHELILTGNVYTDPAGEAVVVPTLGTYTVLVTSTVSNLVDAAVARLDLAQLLASIYIDTVGGDDAGNGTNTQPVQTIARAFDLAAENNLTSFTFRGSLTLDRAAPDWKFTGASELVSTLDINGYNVDGASFASCGIEGTVVGRIEAITCRLDVITGLDGVFRDCGIAATFSTATNADIVMQRCYSEVAGSGAPVGTIGSGNAINFRNWSGSLELASVTAGTSINVDLDPGRLVLGASCTGGLVIVRGSTELDDQSAGTTVLDEGLLRSLSLDELHRIHGLDAAVDLVVTATARTAGAISQTIVESPPGTVTVSR